MGIRQFLAPIVDTEARPNQRIWHADLACDAPIWESRDGELHRRSISPVTLILTYTLHVEPEADRCPPIRTAGVLWPRRQSDRGVPPRSLLTAISAVPWSDSAGWHWELSLGAPRMFPGNVTRFPGVLHAVRQLERPQGD